MKPCPYCGSSNVELFGSDLEYWVGCLDCQAAGPLDKTEVAAMQRWDNRK